MKTCRYCRAKIFGNASVCQYCSAYQNRFRQNLANFGYIATLLVAIVAIAQVFLAFRQLNEAQQARVATLETLERAKQAGARINEVKERVELQSATISQIAQQAQSANEIIKLLENEFFIIKDLDILYNITPTEANSVRPTKVGQTNRDRFFVVDLEKDKKTIMYVDFLMIGLFNKDKPIFYKMVDINGNFELNRSPIVLGKLIDDLGDVNILDVAFDMSLYDINLYKDSEIYKKLIKDSIKSVQVIVIINNLFFVGHKITIDQFECNTFNKDAESPFIRCNVRFDVSEIYKDKDTVRDIYKSQRTIKSSGG